MTTTVRVVIHRGPLRVFTGWTGPVGRSIMRLSRETRFRQIAMVGKNTGRLASSITIGERNRNSLGIWTTIGAGAGQYPGRSWKRGYALWNDQGTHPHKIRPRKPGGMLVFYWPKVGRIVHLRSVSHPGNRPYHWAMRGLRAAMRQWQRAG